MADCDVQALMDDASCFGALAAGQQELAQTQLLCDLRAGQTSTNEALADIEASISGGSAAGVLRHPPGAQALATSAVIKASSGTLISLVFTNTNAAARWLQVFDAAAVPADTAVPLISIQVAAGASGSIDFVNSGLPMLNGISVSNSTTAATKTIGVADSFFTATYR